MSFPSYPKYRDSGVEWLGDVPEHWGVYKLQDLAKNSRYSFVDGPFGSDLKNEEYTESGVPLIQLNNITEGAHILNDIKYVSEEKADQLAKHNAFPGDVVLAKMADPVARAALVKDSFDRYVIVADCIRLSVDETFAIPSFAVYAINSPYFRSHAVGKSSGITRLRINLGALKQIKLAVPLLHEQTQIAAFLDRETSKIDELVAEQQRLMELLKEKRQAVISHAVTKGLNPDAPMKPSGIEWLGEVPEHWEVKRIKHLSSRISSGKTPLGGSEIYVDEGVTFLRSQNVYDEGLRLDDVVFITEAVDETMAVSRVRANDILLNITGASIGRSCVVPSEFSPANVNQHVCVIRLKNPSQVPFIGWLFKAATIKNQIDHAQNGAAREGLNFVQIGDMAIALPPAEEQQAIANFIAGQTAKFDTLTAETQRAIDLLQERRTALISAAVTGQIDVRAAL